MNDISKYYDGQFKKSHVTGSIYESFTPLIEAAHHERMRILDALPIGDVSNKTVVDFGTGSWGFGCVYPRLQKCSKAIGFDISKEAIDISRKVSERGNYGYGSNYEYHVSNGDEIILPDKSVDVLFAGECIEHIENTELFLSEVYRTLKNDGLFILTTPNSGAVMYRSLNQLYAVGPEHIALMNYHELKKYVEKRFVTIVEKGYNTSLHPDIDQNIVKKNIADAVAAMHNNNITDASGMILMMRKIYEIPPLKVQKKQYFRSPSDVTYLGNWSLMPLHESLSGKMALPGDSLSFKFFGQTLIILFWSHAWSGEVSVNIDSVDRSFDLYSLAGGFRRIVIEGLEAHESHYVVIRPTGSKSELSNDNQIIFFSASSYLYS